MKTVMQELWDYIKEDKENINFIVYGKLRNKIIPLLAKEKVQIEDAYDKGYYGLFTHGYEYYEETYN